MLRGRRDRYHRLGFLIPFTVAAIATPIQMAVGDTLARWVYNNEPAKFAAIELVPKTASDVPETLLGHLNSNGTVTRRHPDPRPRVVLSDPSDGHEHRDPGPRRVPGRRAADDRARSTPCTSRGTSWSARHAAVPACRPGTGSTWIFRRDMPKTQVVPAHRVVSPASLAVIAHGSGLGGHRGRPPAVDRPQLHEGRGRRDRQRGRVDHVPRRRRALRRRRRHD